MLSAIIPAFNSASTLLQTIDALAGVDEIVVVDGGSQDETAAVAGAKGARVVTTSLGRGHQLMTGADSAKGPWLLFIHADTVLDPRWRQAVAAHVSEPANRDVAATFRFALDDPSPAARRLERWVAWRVGRFGLP